MSELSSSIQGIVDLFLDKLKGIDTELLLEEGSQEDKFWKVLSHLQEGRGVNKQDDRQMESREAWL